MWVLVWALRGRNVAAKRPATWFQTIDRVDPRLTARPKLLLQDMRLNIHPVLDDGAAYPHHNLYDVVSEKWDMKVLSGLLPELNIREDQGSAVIGQWQRRLD